MQYRALGRTGWNVSTVSFGAWAIGGTWGDVDDAESKRALFRALDCGVNFFDTADVYGDGRSERLLRDLRTGSSQEVLIATKAGRRPAAGGRGTSGLTTGIQPVVKPDVEACTVLGKQTQRISTSIELARCGALGDANNERRSA